jgi:hypothetical protein
MDCAPYANKLLKRFSISSSNDASPFVYGAASHGTQVQPGRGIVTAAGRRYGWAT